MKPYYEDKYVTIYNADCREILPGLPKVDLVLTDPPYGIPIMTDGSFYGGKNRAANGKAYLPVAGNDEQFNPSLLFAASFNQILWGANHYAPKLPHNGRWLVWDKRCQQQPTRTQSDCELAWCSDYGAARIFYHVWDGMIKDSERGIPRQHPTQKPVALMKWCISFYPATKTILDPFLGSGTTVRAAKDLLRKSIGIEIDEKYCEISARRCQQSVFEFKAQEKRDATCNTTKVLL